MATTVYCIFITHIQYIRKPHSSLSSSAFFCSTPCCLSIHLFVLLWSSEFLSGYGFYCHTSCMCVSPASGLYVSFIQHISSESGHSSMSSTSYSLQSLWTAHPTSTNHKPTHVSVCKEYTSMDWTTCYSCAQAKPSSRAPEGTGAHPQSQNTNTKSFDRSFTHWGFSKVCVCRGRDVCVRRQTSRDLTRWLSRKLL